MYKASFKLISPLRVDCLLQPGVEFREPHETHKFWGAVAKKVGAELMRQSPDREGLQYESAHSINLDNDISILEGDLDVPVDYLHDEDPRYEVEGVRWYLCDFGILLVVTRLNVQINGRTAADIEQEVQRNATRVNNELISEMYTKLRQAIQTEEGHDNFVIFDSGPEIEHAWASRALMFDSSTAELAPEQKRFAIDWMSSNQDSEQLIDDLLNRELLHYADWMNYIYVEETPETALRLQEMWKALLRAQFYYAAMGRIDSKLMGILAWAMSKSPDISTAKLREQLRREMDFAEALFLKKSEVGKFVNPASRIETERILSVWDFDEVLANPVRMKLEICQTRLDNLESDRARSASFFTDLILMVIGVTSILGTALAVVSLGRSASADPDQTVYDFGAGDLTTWISTQPIDVILLISTIISVLMVAVFVVARKKSEV